MPIDASIYGLIKQPEAPNLLAQFGQAQQLQAQQNQNQLAALAFQDRERALADATAQREAVRGFGADPTANYNALLRTGNLGAAQGYQKGVTENAAKAAETAQKGVETQGKVWDNYKAMAGAVSSPQEAANLIRASYADPTIAPVISRFGTLEEGLQRLQDAIGKPGGFEQWRAQAAIGAAKLADLVKVNNVNTGGTTITQSVNPATGQVQQLGSVVNTVSPDAQLQANTSTENNKRTTDATRDVAQATRDAAAITKQGASETELRKEYAALPEVKSYKEAIPAYNAIVKASQSNNPQADINLVYGLAKLYDPTSVVREGEYNTIAQSQTIPEWLKGMAQRLVGGGKLTAETKKQILEQAGIRINSYRSEAEGARQGYEAIATRNGLKPANVFVPIGGQLQQPTAPGGAPAASNGNDPLGIR